MNVYNDDKDLKLVSYFLANPSLDDPNLMYDKQTFEIERMLNTCLCTESQNLGIKQVATAIQGFKEMNNNFYSVKVFKQLATYS